MATGSKGNGTGKRRLVADKRAPAAASSRPRKPAAKAPRKTRRLGPVGVTLTVLARAIGGIFRLLGRMIWGGLWRLIAVATVILGISIWYVYSTLPPVQSLMDGRARGSVTMLDRNGNVFAWRGETFDTISVDGMPQLLKNAVIATEDKRFYRHLGLSPRGIASAIKINLAEGRGPLEGNGGSTITQQVAKLLCLGVDYNPETWKSEADYESDCRKSTIWRKVKEVPFSLAMEFKYTKDEILAIYLNRAYLGAGARGFEAASERYFNKSAKDLSAAEAAMLAGLLKAPSYYAPTSNLERSRERAKVILTLMEDQGYLTRAQFDDAVAHPAELSRAATYKAGGWFADWVMDTAPSFLTSDTTEDVILSTTFDQGMQRAAERALKHVFETKVKDGSKAEAAVIVMSADGAVRAMIGGRAAPLPGAFNRATMAKRQPGSSFKPFVFAAALDMGYTPDSVVDDAPISIKVRGQRKPYQPENYTHSYRGPVTLTTALAQSLNTATIRVQEAVGRRAVKQVATDFGFASDLAEGPSLGLGVSESTLIEMTGAYAGILNGGTSVRPYGINELRIRGDQTPLIGKSGGLGERVISQRAADELIWMMRQVVEHGTGTRARLSGRQVAGKTGTTQAARDAWFIGFTAQYVTGVWMGNDDNKPLKGVTGGGLPAEIWQAVMEELHKDLPAEPLVGKPSARAETATTALSANGGNIFETKPSGNPRPATPPAASPDMAEEILKDVLGQFRN